MNLLAEIQNRFRTALAKLTDDPEPFVGMVRPSQNAKFGDFQANCAMPLKNVLNKPSSREAAEDIIAGLDVSDLCEPPEVAGPGFINLTLRDDWLQTQINQQVTDDRLGVPIPTEQKSYIIDYSSPNVAKPMHVGHLRSTVIGAAIYELLTFLGHRVISDNHIGDWGTQFGMIIYGYKYFRDDQAYEAEPVQELARLYRLVNQLCDYFAAKRNLPKQQTELENQKQSLSDLEGSADANDKKLKKQIKQLKNSIADSQDALKATQEKIATVETSPKLAGFAEQHPDIVKLSREETAKLHAGDEENRTLWNEFLPHCLAMLNEVYDRLGIRFDKTLGESFYDPMLADVVAELQAKGFVTESKGAQCIFLEGQKAPFMVQKSDGAFNYATTDLATIKYRHENFDANVFLYVVDKRQSEHFDLLFKTARKWGYDQTDYHHVSFGTVLDRVTRQPYRTRSGDTVGLGGLLDEAVARAYKIVVENDDNKPGGAELSEEERTAVSEKVGIGGIKYSDLNHNRDSDYAFDWETMLATKGDSSTYIQYSYARIASIFRKGDVDREQIRNAGGTIELGHEAERALAIQLLRFADALSDAAFDFRPNLLTQYLFETANAFSVFFEKCPVLKSEGDLKTSRFLLCDLTARILQQGLAILGIETCEKM